MKKLLPIALFGLLSITGIQAQTENGKALRAKSATQSTCLTLEKDQLRSDDGGGYWSYVTAADSYAGGSGTEADPYLIETPEQLLKLSEDATGQNWERVLEGVYFKQIADIDLSSRSCIGFYIGNQGYFAGCYDGNGYSIKGYNYKLEDSSSKSDVIYGNGIFWLLDGATIKNVKFTDYLIDVQYTNVTDFGAYHSPFCYGANNCQFIGCETDGTTRITVKGKGISALSGGMVSYAENTTFDHCRATGSIENNLEVDNGGEYDILNDASGIVAEAINTTIINCTNQMDIKAITSGASENKIYTQTAGIVAWCNNVKIYNNNNLGNIYGDNK